VSSTAYDEYEQNLTDVHRLVLLHRRERGTGRGRRGLGHLTRGGLLLLCAAWERYTETVIVEGATFLTRRLTMFNQLPGSVATRVRNHTNSNGNTWHAAQLTTPDWKRIYLDALDVRVRALNTPKHANLKAMFLDFLNVPDIGTCWGGGTQVVDDFVSLRGEVAHRGGQSRYIRFGQLEAYEASMTGCVLETDNFLSDHLKTLVPPGRRAWYRT